MSKGRILYIDDSEVFLERVRTVLTDAGYDVIATAQTVGTARHLTACDIVLVDFHMPWFDRPMNPILREIESKPTCPQKIFRSSRRHHHTLMKPHRIHRPLRDGKFSDGCAVILAG